MSQITYISTVSMVRRNHVLRLPKVLDVRQCGLPSSTRPNLFSGD